MRLQEFICSFSDGDDPIDGKTKWNDGKITLDLDAVYSFNETAKAGLTAVRTHHEVFMLKISYEEFRKKYVYSVTHVN